MAPACPSGKAARYASPSSLYWSVPNENRTLTSRTPCWLSGRSAGNVIVMPSQVGASYCQSQSKSAAAATAAVAGPVVSGRRRRSGGRWRCRSASGRRRRPRSSGCAWWAPRPGSGALDRPPGLPSVGARERRVGSTAVVAAGRRARVRRGAGRVPGGVAGWWAAPRRAVRRRRQVAGCLSSDEFRRVGDDQTGAQDSGQAVHRMSLPSSPGLRGTTIQTHRVGGKVGRWSQRRRRARPATRTRPVGLRRSGWRRPAGGP